MWKLHEEEKDKLQRFLPTDIWSEREKKVFKMFSFLQRKQEIIKTWCKMCYVYVQDKALWDIVTFNPISISLHKQNLSRSCQKIIHPSVQ